MSEFITITSEKTEGQIGGLSRSILYVTRETVAAAYTPDAETGLIKVKKADVDSFIAANSNAHGLNSALKVQFDQAHTPKHVYILSGTPSSAKLAKANNDPRAWSFITYISESQGLRDSANYFADLSLIGEFVTSNNKICIHTYSIEEPATGNLVLPAQLQKGGAIQANKRIKTIVSNSHKERDGTGTTKIKVYDNVALAWAGFNLYGSAVSRSWGGLSSAHDFKSVKADTYSAANRTVITSAGLGLYNGSKDKAGANFVYETKLNNTDTQIETQSAIDYIEDYVYVHVKNELQKAGQTGLPSDDSGISILKGLVNVALANCFDLNLILSDSSGGADFILKSLTADEVTKLSPDWQKTGVWPAGVISSTIRPFAATHYVQISFIF